MHTVVHDACNAGLADYAANAKATTDDGVSIKPNCLIIPTPPRGESSKVKIRLVGKPVLYLQGLEPFVRPADPRIAEWSEHCSDPEVPSGYHIHYDGEHYGKGPFGPPGPNALFLRYRCFCLDRGDSPPREAPSLKLFDFPASLFDYFKDWNDNFGENPGGKGGPDWRIKLERNGDMLRASVYFLDRAPWTPEERCILSVASGSIWPTMQAALLESVRRHSVDEIRAALVDAEKAEVQERKTFSVSPAGAEARVVQQVGRAVRPVADVLSRQGPSAMADKVEEGPSKVLCLYPDGLYCYGHDMRMLWVYQQGNDGINMNSYHYYDFAKKTCSMFSGESWLAKSLVRVTDQALLDGALNKMRRDLHEQSASVRRLKEAVLKAEGGQEAAPPVGMVWTSAPAGASKPLTPEEYADEFPLRQDITILPGDPPDRPKICPPYVEGSSETPRGEGF